MSDITETSVVLKWKLPIYDGGAPISSYIVQKQDVHRGVWITVSESVTRTTITVTQLKENTDYVFKICAMNRFGFSRPLLSESITAESKFGWYLLLAFILMSLTLYCSRSWTM